MRNGFSILLGPATAGESPGSAGGVPRRRRVDLPWSPIAVGRLHAYRKPPGRQSGDIVSKTRVER